MPFTPQNRKGLRPAPAVSATIDRNPKLPSEQEAELILKAQKGDHDARQQVINANLAWVCSLGGTSLGKGLEDDELLSEGVIALNRAIDQWMPDKGGDIRTYSKDKILKAQSESIATVDPIRLPRSAREQRSKLRKAINQIGEGATVAQLAEQTELREKRVEELQSIAQPSSLNIIVGKGNTELLDLQADLNDSTLALELQSVMEQLEPREQEILHLRFWDGLTFEEIGDFFNLTSQRIQQICKKALVCLRRWLRGEREDDFAPSQAGIENIPVEPQTLWQQFAFAKWVLVTEFGRTLNLKQSKQTPQRQHNRPVVLLPTPSIQGEVEPAQHSGIRCEASHLRVFSTSRWFKVATHRIDSGGLRDGPQHLLDSCWHGLNCLAQFLGDWPRPPQESNQHRCRFRDRRRSRRQTQRKSYSKEGLILNVDWTSVLLLGHQRYKPKTKPKVEIYNKIMRFSRNLNNRYRCNYFSIYSLKVWLFMHGYSYQFLLF